MWFSALTALRIAPTSTPSFCGWKRNLLLFSRALGVSNLTWRRKLNGASETRPWLILYCEIGWQSITGGCGGHYLTGGHLGAGQHDFPLWLRVLFIFTSVSQRWVLETGSNKLQAGMNYIFLGSLTLAGGGQRTADHFLDFSYHSKILF